MAMFGSSWLEDTPQGEYDKGKYDGQTEGRKSGFNDGIKRCQLLINQSISLSHAQKTALYNELEELKWK